jgi:microcystin-dependent protein
MGSPYVGEIRMFGGNFAPAGWAFCNGQLVPISQNDVLFTLIGTTYGGDGQNTFGLPDLQGRIPLHMGTDAGTGTTFSIGEKAGSETVTLTTQQLPSHNHALMASTNAAGSNAPANNMLATTTTDFYFAAPATAALAPQSIGPSGGGNQPHENLMPFLAVSFIISLFGIFPTQN